MHAKIRTTNSAVCQSFIAISSVEKADRAKGQGTDRGKAPCYQPVVTYSQHATKLPVSNQKSRYSAPHEYRKSRYSARLEGHVRRIAPIRFGMGLGELFDPTASEGEL